MPQRYEEPEDQGESQDDLGPENEEYVEIAYAEQPFGPSTVIVALDQIKNLVNGARAVPLSANIVLNKAEILDLVAQATDALPDDLVAANEVVSDADAVLIRADSAAEAAVAEAGAKATSLLDDARNKADTVIAEATDEAQRTVKRAKEEADLTQSRAKSEAERILQEARAQVEEMVAGERVTELATERARATVANAKSEADRLKRGADQYVSATLNQLLVTLDDLQRRTSGGLKKVSDRSEPEEAANIALD